MKQIIFNIPDNMRIGEAILSALLKNKDGYLADDRISSEHRNMVLVATLHSIEDQDLFSLLKKYND